MPDALRISPLVHEGFFHRFRVSIHHRQVGAHRAFRTPAPWLPFLERVRALRCLRLSPKGAQADYSAGAPLHRGAPRTRATSQSPRPICGRFWLPNVAQALLPLPSAWEASDLGTGRSACATLGLTFPHPRSSVRLMDYQKYITIEPGKRGGKPCIRGMRITVYEVLDYLASGMTEAEILADFPDLTAEDLKACLAFAADRERKLVTIPS